MSNDLTEGYRNLVHFLACHEYRHDDDCNSASIELAMADFKSWMGEEPTPGGTARGASGSPASL